MYNRIVFGNLKIDYTTRFNDMTKREFFVFLPLILFVLLMGLYPSLFTGLLHVNSYTFLFEGDPHLQFSNNFLLNNPSQFFAAVPDMQVKDDEEALRLIDNYRQIRKDEASSRFVDDYLRNLLKKR